MKMLRKQVCIFIIQWCFLWISYAAENCSVSLGASATGYLSKTAFTASSESRSYGASQGRLNGANHAWIPARFQPTEKVPREYLQVDLGRFKTVTGVSTQGLIRGVFFVKTYSLKFSKDGKGFEDFYHVRKKKVFDGNTDGGSVVTQTLPCPVTARYVQFYPIEYVKGIALKVDILGCDKIAKKLPSIRNFRAAQITSSSVNLYWEQLSKNVFSYTFAYHPVGGRNHQYQKYILHTKGGTLPILYNHVRSGLLSCTSYKFILQVYNMVGCGIPEVYSRAVATLRSNPVPPFNFHGDALVPQTIRLSWEKSQPGYLCADKITGFVIYYKTQQHATEGYRIVQLPSTATEYNLVNLNSWQKYRVKIASINNIGRSDFIAMEIDVDGEPPEEPPVITSIVSDKPNTILVTWRNPPLNKVNGPIQGYSAYYRLKSNNWIYIGLASPSTATTIRISSLESWKRYEVYISLYNFKFNISSQIKEVLVKGSAPGLGPANIVAHTVTTTSIGLTWDPPPAMYIPGVFQGYLTYYQLTGTSDLILSHPNKTMETQRDIQNLQPGTNYTFKVLAVSNNQKGPFSDEIVVSTAKGDLIPPKITVLRSTHPNSFNVQWTVEPNVIVSSFKLRYKLKENFDQWTSKDLITNVMYFTVDQLLPWKQYDVEVVLNSLGRENKSSLWSVFVVGRVPGRPPTEIKLEKSGYTFLHLTWKSIDPKFIFGEFKGYQIKYIQDGDINAKKYNVTVYNNISISDLQPNQAYRIQIAGMTALGVGVYSRDVMMTTRWIVSLDPPLISVVENIPPTKIKIKWNVTGDNRMDITWFLITLSDMSAKLEVSHIHRSTTTMYMQILKVAPYTQYRIEIQSCIKNVCSMKSDSRQIKSLESAPSKVEDLTVLVRPDDVEVSWNKPKPLNGVLRKFIVDVQNNKTNNRVDGYPKELDADIFALVLHKLPAYEILSVEVKAATVIAGPGAIKVFQSPEGLPSEPTNVIVVLLKDNEMMSIKWEKPEYPNGVITGYKIFYKGEKYYHPTFKHSNTTYVSAKHKTLLRVDGLMPGTTYHIQVFARTIKGYGQASRPTRTIRTKFKPPMKPPQPLVRLSGVTSNSIIVQLKPAVQQFGPIYSYQVIVEESESGSTNVVERLRRSLNVLPKILYGYDQAKRNKARFYIAADVLAQKVPAKFQVGDGKVYHGYKNQQLKPETNYNLYVRATTKSDGNNGDMLYGEVVSVELPRTAAAIPDGSKSFPVPIPILIGVCAGLIFIIVVVIIIVCYIRSSRRKKKDEMDPFELGLLQLRPTSVSALERPVSLTGDYPIHPDHPPIPVSTFPKHVAKLHRMNNNGFKAEYNQLEIGKEYSWDIAHLPENKQKNRYTNIVAYDHSRVILSTINGMSGSDYINASYSDGLKKPNAYISTQGPLPNTFNDFWRMVWEVRSCAIVMLTNLQEKNKLKCHKYWPDDCTEYGDIIVTLVRKEPLADYTIRTFKLEKVPCDKNSNSEIQEVKQFHFTSWPDHGVPNHATALLRFNRRVRAYNEPDSGPMIVHCSAGVGRTGAYIVIDSVLDRVQQQMDVDIFNCIFQLRTRRIAMVQTEDQYIFVHDTIVESIISGNTEIPLQELRSSIKALNLIECDSRVSGFEKQWKTLNHASPILPKSDFFAALQIENLHKNRYSTVIPADSNRVLLLPIDDNEGTTYINAVYVDSYKQRNAFILTQSPLPKTVSDFWRMVCEHGSTSVVMLNAIDEGDDYSMFWPDSGLREYDMVNVECLLECKNDDMLSVTFLKPMYRIQPSELVVRSFKVTDTHNPSNSFELKLFQYLGWTETRVPNNYKAVINLLTQLERWQQYSGNGPITILCSDGIGRSGTLAAIIYALERVKLERVLDVFQAIKAMRIQRPHVVKYMDQYKYIHFAVQEYLNAFQEYTKL